MFMYVDMSSTNAVRNENPVNIKETEISINSHNLKIHTHSYSNSAMYSPQSN